MKTFIRITTGALPLLFLYAAVSTRLDPEELDEGAFITSGILALVCGGCFATTFVNKGV